MGTVKGLNCVEQEYRKLLREELSKAIANGEPERAAAFSRELAKLTRKENRMKGVSDEKRKS